MDLPTQSWPSGLGVDIQSLLDQSEIFPRIFQIGDKEKAAEDLSNKVGKCELEVIQSHDSNPFGESSFDSLKLTWWERQGQCIFKSKQLHSCSSHCLVSWSNKFIFCPRPVQMGFSASGEIHITTRRWECCCTWEMTRTWHTLHFCQDLFPPLSPMQLTKSPSLSLLLLISIPTGR